MSDKTYIGNKAGKLDDKGAMPPISRVTLFVDDKNYYTAGDDTGRELKKTNPHATQAMADSILSAVVGYQHRPYRAQNALLDPAAELGDGATVGGLYSQIGYTVVDFGPAYTAEVSAPGSKEIDEEFGSYVSQTEREYNRQLAQTRSLISKTSEQIRQEVSNEIDGMSASFDIQLQSITAQIESVDGRATSLELGLSSITARVEDAEESIEVTLTALDGLTVTDSTGTTRIKGSSVETDTLYVNAANISGTLTADQVNLTGAIKWSSLSSGMQSIVDDIENTANDAYNMADSAYDMALDTSDIVSDWSYTYGGTTYIDGTMLMTGTVTASSLQGGEVILLGSNGREAASFTLTGATSYSGRKLVVDSGAIEISAAYGDVFVSGGDGAYVQLSDEVILGGGDTRPNQNNYWSCGTSTALWSDVYAYNGTIVTSDLTKKHDIVYGLDRFDRFFDGLMPMSFVFNENTSGRTHIGLGAQDVEQDLIDSGLTSMDFAGFIKSPRKDETGQVIEGEYDYALRYSEFVPLLIEQVQRLKNRVNELEGKLS